MRVPQSTYLGDFTYNSGCDLLQGLKGGGLYGLKIAGYLGFWRLTLNVSQVTGGRA